MIQIFLCQKYDAFLMLGLLKTDPFIRHRQWQNNECENEGSLLSFLQKKNNKNIAKHWQWQQAYWSTGFG